MLSFSIKNINWSLYWALLLTGFIPTLYTTLRLFLINDLPNDDAVNIASQIQWLALLYEILQEAIILPLFYIFGRALASSKEVLATTYKTTMLIALIIFVTASAIIYLCLDNIITLMGSELLLAELIPYFRLEILGLLLLVLVQINSIALTLLTQVKSIYYLLGVQLLLTCFFDVFFLSNLQLSMKLGVLGIGYSNIISYSVIFFLGLYLISKQLLFCKAKFSFSYCREWIKLGSYSGLESFIRNIAYIVMIIHMMNMVNEQGLYWQVTSFIWAWLLLPITKLGELIKRDAAENSSSLLVNYKDYTTFTLVIVSIWILLFPFYEQFFEAILNYSAPYKMYNTLLKLLPFYIVFAFSQIWTSSFYGLGKTNYIFYSSLFTNFVYYGLFYVLYIHDVFCPTLDSVIYMFGGGLICTGIISHLQFYKIKQKLLGSGFIKI